MTTTHSHNFRCDDKLWAAAKGAAAAEGRTVTDVIVAALRRLVAPTYPRVEANEQIIRAQFGDGRDNFFDFFDPSPSP
jgi:hypothetical protein